MRPVFSLLKRALNYILLEQTNAQHTPLNTFSPAPAKTSAYSDDISFLTTSHRSWGAVLAAFADGMETVLQAGDVVALAAVPYGVTVALATGNPAGLAVAVTGYAYTLLRFPMKELNSMAKDRTIAAQELEIKELKEVVANRCDACKAKSDVASSWEMNFQTPATDIMEKIVDLHHDLMFFLIVIVLFVSWVLARLIGFYQSTDSVTSRVAFSHHTLLEKIWTYIPAGILVLIASPSFSLLYSIDALTEPQISVKVIGHQWYWSYETTDLVSAKDINFDSYMTLEADLPDGGLRLLEVDNRLALPIRTNIRLIITAADVLHSWALPALGVKMDACPGRLNQVSLHLNRSGVFYGQCSELCGINHSFMPVVVDAVTREQYRRWLDSQE